MKNGFARTSTEATQIDAEGRLVVLATGDGVVTEIASERGTFVQSATQLATVQRADTLYVQAEYTLTPKEYARVADDATATVVLPNQRTITVHVSEVKVETIAGSAQAVLTLAGELARGRGAERPGVRRHAGDRRAAAGQRRGGDADRGLREDLSGRTLPMTTRTTGPLTEVRPPPTSRRRWWVIAAAAAVVVALAAVLVVVAPWADDDPAPADGRRAPDRPPSPT